MRSALQPVSQDLTELEALNRAAFSVSPDFDNGGV
jgi:hypothetical protein